MPESTDTTDYTDLIAPHEQAAEAARARRDELFKAVTAGDYTQLDAFNQADAEATTTAARLVDFRRLVAIKQYDLSPAEIEAAQRFRISLESYGQNKRTQQR